MLKECCKLFVDVRCEEILKQDEGYKERTNRSIEIIKKIRARLTPEDFELILELDNSNSETLSYAENLLYSQASRDMISIFCNPNCNPQTLLIYKDNPNGNKKLL